MESRNGDQPGNVGEGSFRLGLATASTLLLQGGFSEDLAVAIRRDGGAERALAALQREFFPETVTVPEMLKYDFVTAFEDAFRASGVNVVIKINRHGDLIHNVHQLADLIGNDLEASKGKTFSVLRGSFAYFLTSSISQARSYQQERSCDANAAALLTWLMQTQPAGTILSVSNDEQRFAERTGKPTALSCQLYGLERRLEIRLSDARYQPEVATQFVAFREVLG